MIIKVKDIHETKQGDYTNLEVFGLNTRTNKDTTQLIFSTLRDKWGLIKKDGLVELVMQNKGTRESPKWQVTDIKEVPEATGTEVQPEKEKGQEPKEEKKGTRVSGADWDRQKNESIEQEVAFRGFIDLAIAKVITTESQEYKTARNWGISKLGYWSSMGEDKKPVNGISPEQDERIIELGKQKGFIIKTGTEKTAKYDPKLLVALMLRLFNKSAKRDLTNDEASELIKDLEEDTYPVTEETIPF